MMKETGEEPKKIIESKGLQQESDPKELEGIIDKILAMIIKIKLFNINLVKKSYLVFLLDKQ